jgi:hypothetical protein
MKPEIYDGAEFFSMLNYCLIMCFGGIFSKQLEAIHTQHNNLVKQIIEMFVEMRMADELDKSSNKTSMDEVVALLGKIIREA